MIKKIIIFLFIFVLTVTAYSKASAQIDNCQEISNKYFSFTMPSNTEGTYIVEKRNNAIYIIEKTSAESGEGGFAFGFNIFKNPKDYAKLEDYTKIGELTDKNGILYDVILERPVENRCGDEEKTIENFLRLYDSAKNIEIKGVNGSIYNKNQGMKGEDLYKEILGKYKQAIEEHWNYSRIKQENLESVSKVLVENKKASLKKIGYAYYDINSDGIDELFIGEISKSNGTIYDMYTIVNRKPKNVFSQYNRQEKYYVCNDNLLCEEICNTKDKKMFAVHTLENNSTNRPLLVEYMYNKELNRENPWFRTYTAGNQYERISKETYNQEISTFDDYKKFNYIPLSKLDSNDKDTRLRK